MMTPDIVPIIPKSPNTKTCSKIIFIFSSLYTNERNPGIRVTTKAIISNKHNRSINKIVRSFMTFHHQYQYPFVPVFEIVRKERHFRSEEHTSELQSRFDLVCRLLLE